VGFARENPVVRGDILTKIKGEATKRYWETKKTLQQIERIG
jgi:hypothetical protein